MAGAPGLARAVPGGVGNSHYDLSAAATAVAGTQVLSSRVEIVGVRIRTAYDAQRAALPGRACGSRPFRARGRGLSHLAAHPEHADPQARGISRGEPDRAQREVRIP